MDTILQTALSVITTALLAGLWAALTKRYKLEDKREQTLNEVQVSLAQLNHKLDDVKMDSRCQYEALLASFEAQETQLHALKGHKMNGNVDEALEKLAKAKTELQRRLLAQACK